MTAPDAVATAVAWKDGRILAVGSDADVRAVAKAEGVPVEDAAGTTVIPGFVDAHMHFLHVGVKRMRPDLQDATSLQDALYRVRAWLAENPGKGPVTAEGWDESRWPENRPPTRDELDEVTDRPLVLRRIDGHFAVANTAALGPVRRRWDDNELVDLERGVLLEDASLYLNEVLPAGAPELDEAVRIACETAHRLGVTAVHDYSQAPFRAALLRAAHRDRLRVRVASGIYVQQLEDERLAGFRTGRPGPAPDDRVAARSGEADEHAPVSIPTDGGTSPWIRDGGLKVFHDGSFGGFTAWLHDPYEGGKGAGPDGCGTPIWSHGEARDWYRKAHAAGIQVHGHAIGDAAIDQALESVAALEDDGPGPWPGNAPDAETPDRAAMRHRIEHYELPSDDAVARTKALGVVASCQPNFVGHWSAKGGMYEHRLGRRFLRNNRYRSWLDQGLQLAFGSDGMPFGPLYGLQSAVEHPLPGERLTAAEAVWLYTARAAWSIHWEDAIGTLEPGKHADLLLLDQADLDARPPMEWVIQETVVGGETLCRGTAPVPSA